MLSDRPGRGRGGRTTAELPLQHGRQAAAIRPPCVFIPSHGMEICLPQVCPSESSSAEISTDEMSCLQVGLRQVSISENGLAQIGSVETGTMQSGVLEIGFPEVGSDQPGSGEVGSIQPRCRNKRRTQISATKIGVSQRSVFEAHSPEARDVELHLKDRPG